MMTSTDEGTINSFTVPMPAGTDDAGHPTGFRMLVVNVRDGRPIKCRCNKTVGDLSALISSTNAGSSRHPRLVLAKKKAQSRAKKKLSDFDHQVATKAASFVRAHGARRIVSGDVRGIEQHTNRQRRAHWHPRQQLSQWPRGGQDDYLVLKTGIGLEHISEA